MKLKSFEIFESENKVVEPPASIAEIGHFYTLQKEIKKMEAELQEKKLEFKKFEEELRPMMDSMKSLGLKMSVTEKYIIEITRFGGERKDVSYKNAFENALSKVNAATKKVLQASLEASKSITQVKHSFNIDKLEESKLSDFGKRIKDAIKSAADKFMKIFSKAEDDIEDANNDLKQLADHE
jgi:hypothetical protein